MIHKWMRSRQWLHFPLGVATALMTLIGDSGNTLAWICALGFFVYELNEDRHIGDQAWKDIAGWIGGVLVGAGVVATIVSIV